MHQLIYFNPRTGLRYFPASSVERHRSVAQKTHISSPRDPTGGRDKLIPEKTRSTRLEEENPLSRAAPRPPPVVTATRPWLKASRKKAGLFEWVQRFVWGENTHKFLGCVL